MKNRPISSSLPLAPSVLCACLLSLSPGCAQARPDVTEATKPVRVADAKGAPGWIKMALLSPEQKQAGIFPGGEGCQWPRALEISTADPNFLLLGIDVGGLYRTLDGGKYWEQASVGWNARGCNGLAIDPKNPAHVLGLGGNSLDWNSDWGQTPNGVYLSMDRAASWKTTLGLLEGYGNSVAFDPASFDPARKICTIAYVASPKAGLLKTTDGGETWSMVSELPATLGLSESNNPVRVRVSPTGGVVYLGGKGGFYVSSDGGKNFTKTSESSATGIAVVPQVPQTVWISGSQGLLVSRDLGKTFTALSATGVDREADNKAILNVVVSPADPNQMTIWVEGANWKWVRYVSHDGGKAFSPIQVVQTADRFPLNVRNGYNAWHPTDPNVLYGLGGDIVTRSSDGGRTLTWFNNGYNGVMLGGMMNFSAHDPKSVFLAFQDYNGAFTNDGGATWNYRDVSGNGWGGHCYGGHAVDANTMFYGDAEGWGAPRRLRITQDGGATWSFVKDSNDKNIILNGANVSLSDPTDPNILFCYDHRSTDKGKTWELMRDCDGVFTWSPGTKVLFGAKNDSVLSSKDQGATWTKIADTTGGISDIAVDHMTGRVYIASAEQLKVWSSGKWETIALPADQFGKPLRCVTVATDPRNPNVVYVGGPRNTYATHCTIARSTDRGATWRNLTVTTPIHPGVDNGPHEVSCIRVHPVTGDAWVAGQCYGMWRIPAPSVGETGKTAALASAPRSPQPELARQIEEKPVAVLRDISIQNGDMEVGGDIPDGWSDRWVGRGSITLSRDTTHSRSGKASLRVTATGDSQGQGAQPITDAPAGATFTIQGAIKSRGNVKVNFAVQPRNDTWAPIGFQQIGYAQNDSDWQSFTKKITLPAGSVHAMIVLLVEGTGDAWLDDVKIVADPGKK